jgi:hypothetical protein
MGKLVEPMCDAPRTRGMSGTDLPSNAPAAMADRIQSGSRRSSIFSLSVGRDDLLWSGADAFNARCPDWTS